MSEQTEGRGQAQPDVSAILAAANQRLLIDRRELALLLGIGKTTVDKLSATGKLPAPVHVSAAALRWRRAEIEAWVEAGMPDAQTWAAIRAAARSARNRHAGA